MKVLVLGGTRFFGVHMVQDMLNKGYEVTLATRGQTKDPFVIGTDDYTERLKFYVEHIKNEMPMNIDNAECQINFIRSDEAGKMLSFMVESSYVGAINGCSSGTISIKEIIDYIGEKTGKSAKVDLSGDEAPYNGTREHNINTEIAQGLGFKFTSVKDWIFGLLDYYI